MLISNLESTKSQSKLSSQLIILNLQFPLKIIQIKSIKISQ